ncbi:thiamine pyrophosphate-binding protein [Iodobacter arcticus]|uniref:Thiamine pyrophosphate-binding protein n=1 Tax=Iodobacter arcticus TaxID=590593 RepID=A0ABW2QY25_9NEIS
MAAIKYSDLISQWLVELGYESCFSLGGGNIMHLAESVSQKIKLIPVVNEVAAGIATEYYTETGAGKKAFALVTAGPGLTNIITAIAGAYQESRELLVIGGQVKTADLSNGLLRQRGIQEIDGVRLVESITKKSIRLLKPVTKNEFFNIVKTGWTPRKGPVFIEIPLDVQGAIVNADELNVLDDNENISETKNNIDTACGKIISLLKDAKRPIVLLGGGVDRAISQQIGHAGFVGLALPVMTTWNGADRIGSEHPYYFGRPNTWGQRYSNILIQQADLIIALGTRLGLQQTGFNWQEFAVNGKVIQVDCDQAELDKGHPNIYLGICDDANQILLNLSKQFKADIPEWLTYCNMVKRELPIVENCNEVFDGYLSPYTFLDQMSRLCTNNDVVIPCSSGSAFTASLQIFQQKFGQYLVTNKSLASMGYGLGGAIGAALANPQKRTVLFEGDGGFSQNLQELGTAKINQLNLKIFIFDDQGYASIRMTQRSYFAGRYVGCDIKTGVGLPNFDKLFSVYDIPVLRIYPGFENDPEFLAAFNGSDLYAFLVTINPEQTYFPKITSRVLENGSMASNPLHKMTPELPDTIYQKVTQYLTKN